MKPPHFETASSSRALGRPRQSVLARLLLLALPLAGGSCKGLSRNQEPDWSRTLYGEALAKVLAKTDYSGSARAHFRVARRKATCSIDVMLATAVVEPSAAMKAKTLKQVQLEFPRPIESDELARALNARYRCALEYGDERTIQAVDLFRRELQSDIAVAVHGLQAAPRYLTRARHEIEVGQYDEASLSLELARRSIRAESDERDYLEREIALTRFVLANEARDVRMRMDAVLRLAELQPDTATKKKLLRECMKLATWVAERGGEGDYELGVEYRETIAERFDDLPTRADRIAQERRRLASSARQYAQKHFGWMSPEEAEARRQAWRQNDDWVADHIADFAAVNGDKQLVWKSPSQ